MKQVKGTMLISFVKGIRANKSGVYENLLSEKDKEIVYQKILNGAWYPFETFKNCMNAVTQVEAKNNMEIVRNWGRDTGQTIMETIYKSALSKGDPQKAWRLYQRFFKLWFNFGYQDGDFISENALEVTFKEFDPDFKNFYHIAMGWSERFLELVIDKKVVSKFLAKSWESDEETIIHYSWSL